MYGKKMNGKQQENQMDKSDIIYIKEILQTSNEEKNWDGVDEAIEILKEFLDDDGSSLEE